VIEAAAPPTPLSPLLARAQDRTTLPSQPAATMGFKGIKTDYLPSSTVVIKTVEVPGTKERLYQ
jgi:hypothetical protein